MAILDLARIAVVTMEAPIALDKINIVVPAAIIVEPAVAPNATVAMSNEIAGQLFAVSYPSPLCVPLHINAFVIRRSDRRPNVCGGL